MRRRTPFAASLSSLSGCKKPINIIRIALSKINLFSTITETGSSSQCQEPHRLKLSSTAFTEEDDFSELGKPVIKTGLSSEMMTKIPPSLELVTKKFSTSMTEDYNFSELSAPAKTKQMASLKLMTEKPDHFMEFKPAPTKDMSTNKLSQEKSLPSIKDILLSLDEPPNNVKTNPVDPAVATRTNEKNQDRSHINKKGIFRNSVAVQNVPTTFGLSTVVEAISKFGKVGSASMMRISSGFCCRITFESAESSKRAILAGKVTVLGSDLSVCPWSKPHFYDAPHDRPKNVTIRILGLSHDTPLEMILSFCKSVGCLEGVAVKQWKAVDAVFRVYGDLDVQHVLNMLNGAIIGERRCSAKILHEDDNDPAVKPMNQPKRDEMGLQVSSQLKELNDQLNLQTLYAEDLYNLHLAIMHLESHSGTSTRNSSLAS